MSRPPNWRDEAASGLAVKHLLRLDPDGPALVALDPLPDVGDHLESRGHAVTRWHRRALGGRDAAPWPEPGPFATVALRLSRAKEELEWALHACASVLRSDGRLFVHGANDEGIRSADGRIEEVMDRTWKVASGGKCRLLEARHPADASGLRDSLEAWRTTFELPLEEIERPWVSYPGVFAHGRLDRGTRLLLGSLPGLPAGAAVLDFGCGSGIIGAVVRERGERIEPTLLDVDSVALAAARENVPGARTVLGDGLGAVGDVRFDVIVSNPPYHAGKAESTGVLRSLVEEAPARLAEGGFLVVVTQRRLGVQAILEERFRRVDRLAEDSVFGVWRAADG